MARRRRLTPEERRLWEQVAATAVPLNPVPTVTPPPAGEPVPVARPAPAPVAPPEPPARRPPPPADPLRTTVDLAPDPHAWLDRATPNMDRRRFDRLRRGRLEPEARLDLHGMTSEVAHAALTGFILSAHARDLRLVLVITGKGRAGDGGMQPHRHGILRHSLPHWLAAPPLAGRILQIAPAHHRHGGGGAYYVYLRRRR
jgi:DNA-nicking Smr family endonuclease